MKIIIRPTKFHDITQMMEVNENSLPENYNREFWSQKFHEGKTHSFVAIGLGKVIGYIFCDDQSIISFAIDEMYRGKGIGKQLIHHCLNTYKSPVRLHVRVNNFTALKLYRSLGFTEAETLKDYYVEPVEDAYLMEWKPAGVRYLEHHKMNIK
ncbi:ribosomal RNA methyltransferase FtsJ domain protein [Fadolivirus algeromassiliense]|jgi:ribosomal-protein-alanine N-acetyltransferase|uniref:Ribosomal RNA methyltransferase FtsJ domain protein n=1 Tax=Fadolivirus FV1/VV64 TaxID=3070911 RepID=A0A7D3UWC4_9VIRU|nr:ribosomal RNA methyltransferase FtsJ domain protein [Fadolivirus algeromassiliense]QKF94734.1 ribosomal RNA methyltransferase FtsJ domain protein [Fadolivirus FV1/VV64]